MQFKVRNLVLLVSVSLLAVGAADADCIGSSPITNGNSQIFTEVFREQPYFYYYPGYGALGYYASTVPPVSPDAKTSFWILGAGNPTAGLGTDNGTYSPLLGGLSFRSYPQYYGLAYAADLYTTWQAPTTDGCPAPGTCAAVLMSDQLNGDSFFAVATGSTGCVLSKAGCSAATITVNQGGVDPSGVFETPIVLRRLPWPVVVADNPPTDFQLLPSVPSVSGPAEGIYDADLCGVQAIGYHVYSKVLPGGSPPPLDRDITGWTRETTIPVPIGGPEIIPYPSCTPGDNIYLALSLVFSDGFETEVVSRNATTPYGGYLPCGGGCSDQDFDGTCDAADCAPNDPASYPGAPELCDGNDNACSGSVPADESDIDGDNYVQCQSWVDSQGDDPTILGGGDCNDADPNIHPGAAEVCDGIDNDCNGQVDDGPDADSDGVADFCDNCPIVANAGQNDFDNDGLGDACDEEIALSAEQLVAQVTGSSDVGAIEIGDVDGDGDDDLVAVWNNHPAYLYLGNGDGTFDAGQAIGGSTGGTALVLTDINRDGDPDLVTTGADLKVWLSDPFVPLGTAAPAAFVIGPHDTIAATDVDGDGYVDLLLGGNGVSTLLINLNGGALVPQTFGLATDVTTAFALGDVDDDGDVDVIEGNQGTNRLRLNDRTATPFATGINLPGSNATRALALEDVDRDGDLDLVEANDGQNFLYLNDGTGSFAAGVAIDGTAAESTSLALGDLDLDGDLDLVEGRKLEASVPARNQVYLNNGTADPWGFVAAIPVSPEQRQTNSIRLADLDGDGDLDVVQLSQEDRTISVHENELIHRNAVFPSEITVDAVGPGGNWVRNGVLGDVDGDGDLDLVVPHDGARNQLYLNNGTDDPWNGVSGLDITTDARASNNALLGDVDGDGDLDLVVSDFGNTSRLYLNDGAGDPWDTAAGIDVTTDTNVQALDATLADVDGDGDLDYLVADINVSAIRLYLNDGVGDPWDTVATSLQVPIPAGNTPWGIALGDADGDGDLDLAVGPDNNNATVYYLPNDGVGNPWDTAAPVSLPGANFHARDVTFGDVDGDGDLDLVAGRFLGSNQLYLNNGTSDPWNGVTPIDITTDTSAGFRVDLVDVDLDGDLDLFTANQTLPSVLYLNDGDGDPWDTLATGITLNALDSYAHAIGDTDGDGDPDLVVISPTPVHLQLNQGGQYRLETTDVAQGGQLLDGMAEPIFQIDLTHNGRAGDSDIELASLELLFESAPGVPLGVTEFNSLFDGLRLYLDDGDGLFDEQTDTPTSGSYAALAGPITIRMQDNDASFRVGPDMTQTYFLVAVMANNASTQATNSFFVTHLTESSSVVEDASTDIPLRGEFAADTTSAPVSTSSDSDLDGIVDSADNCPTVFNPRQELPGVKVSGPMTPGGNVIFSTITPDETTAIYVADQDVDGVQELYAGAMDGSGWIKLNPDFSANPAGRFVVDYGISFNSDFLVYWANNDGADDWALWYVEIDGTNTTRLTQPFPSGGVINEFILSADGTFVLFRGEGDTLGTPELYKVTIPGGVQTKLSGAFPPDSNAILVNSLMHAVYLSNHPSGGESLYAVPIDGSSAPYPLYDPVGTGFSNIGGFEFATRTFRPFRDATRVLFTADYTHDEVYELYSVPITGGTPTRLTPAPTPGTFGVLDDFTFTPGNQTVIFRADLDTPFTAELYSVPVDGSAPPTRINDPLPAGVGVDSFIMPWSADDGTDILYNAAPAGFRETFSVPASGELVSQLDTSFAGGITYGTVTLHTNGKVITLADTDSSGSSEVYLTPLNGLPSYNVSFDQDFGFGYYDRTYIVMGGQWDTVGTTDLYSVSMLGGGPVRLNPPLVPGGNVFDVDSAIGTAYFAEAPWIVYYADQDTVGVTELYSVNLFTGGDNDGDGILNACDNCIDTANPDQADDNANGLGDACDACGAFPFDDPDSDGICEPNDNCSFTPNPAQTDTDGDGAGDLCDLDDDNDGVSDSFDLYPLDPQLCRDNDFDNCDDCSANPVSVATPNTTPWATYSPDPNNDGVDSDGDGVCSLGDFFDFDPFTCSDADFDGCDDCASGSFDLDNDGTDLDGDFLCDFSDPDIDNDGEPNGSDLAPSDPRICRDVEPDGCDDCSQNPTSTASAAPWIPYQPDPGNDGLDTDGDGLCNTGDDDDDGDGLLDSAETTTDPLNADTDSDGLSDSAELEQGTDPTDPRSSFIGVPFSGAETISPTEDGVQQVLAADMDGDGDLDTISASSGNTVVWFENTGNFDDDAFGDLNVISDQGATAIAAADMDGDGDQDIVAAGSSLLWFENDGSGVFGAGNVISGCCQVYEALIPGDFDNDGDFDIVTGGEPHTGVGLSTVVLWTNDGFWTPLGVTTSAGLGPAPSARAVELADLDRDGDLDILVAAQSGGLGNLVWHPNLMPGVGAEAIISPTGDTRALAVADVDDDGDPDVVSATDDSILLHTNTALAFTSATISATTQFAIDVGIADLDSDGDDDIVSASRDDDTVGWHENLTGDGMTWAVRQISTSGDAPVSVAIADLDRDGDDDLISASAGDARVAWHRNKSIHSSALFPFAGNQILIGSQLSGLDLDDVDRDGDLDAIAAERTPALFWRDNTVGDGSTWVRHLVASGGVDQFVEAIFVDVDADGDRDIVTGEIPSGALAWHENTAGDGTVWTRLAITVLGAGATEIDIVSADVSGNGAVDLVSIENGGGNLTLHANLGGAAFANQVIAAGIGSVSVEDVDGDGDLDLVTTFSATGGISWWNNTAGDGSIWTEVSVAAGANAVTAMASDVDRDGDIDALYASNTAGMIGWYENTAGDGSTWTLNTIAGAAGATNLAVADLDGDGDPDVLAAELAGPLDWYENSSNDGRSWTQKNVTMAVTEATEFAAADIDDDGDQDVVLLDSAATLFTWHENRGGQYSLSVTDTTPPIVFDGRQESLLSVTATVNGRVGDSAATLLTLQFAFDDGTGAPLSNPLADAELVALLADVQVYLDRGEPGFTPDTDVLISSLAPLAPAPPDSGVLTVTFPLDDVNLRVLQPATFFVVATVAPDGSQAIPNTFRITLQTAASGLADANALGGLEPEPATDVSSIQTVVRGTTTVETLIDGHDVLTGDGICATVGVPGSCTLRAAVMEANANPGNDRIELGPGVHTLVIEGDDDTGAFGDLDLTDATGTTTIVGAGADVTFIDAQAIDRVFDLRGTAAVFQDLTIVNGLGPAGQSGGALRLVLGSNVTLERVRITGNQAEAGGGIYVEAGSTLSIIDSTVADNSASLGDGGGLLNAGNLTLDRSLIARNSAANNGGGIDNTATATASIDTSTLSANQALSADGGGVRNAGALVLTSSAVFENIAAGTGGGLRLINTASARNSVLAGNSATSGADCLGTIDSLGYNIVQDANVAECAISNVVTGNQLGIDPLLLPLQDNGGPTETHEPFLGSPAIDAGACDGSVEDQRGFERPTDIPTIPNRPTATDDGCDVGPVEVELAKALVPLEIPIRWCIVEGSPTQVDPGAVGASTVGEALRNRIQSLTDGIYSPRGSISFVSGGTANSPEYPVLPDPVLAPSGVPGDVMIDPVLSDYQEFVDLIADCKSAWEQGEGAVDGIVAVAMNRFVDPEGDVVEVIGLGGRADFLNANQQALAGRVMVIDGAYRVDVNPADPYDRTLGHELGHALSLNHGDGEDGDGDGELDNDDEEGSRFDGPNLMQYRDGEVLTNAQIIQMRLHAVTTIPETNISIEAYQTDEGEIDQRLADVLDFRFADVLDFRFADVLDFERRFADVLDFRFADVLDFRFADVLDFRFADVLDFGASFDLIDGVETTTIVTSTGGVLWPQEFRPGYTQIITLDVDDSTATGGNPREYGFPGETVAEAVGIDLIVEVGTSSECDPDTGCTEVEIANVWQWIGTDIGYVLRDDAIIPPEVGETLFQSVPVGLTQQVGPDFEDTDTARIGTLLELKIRSQVIVEAGGEIGRSMRMEVLSVIDCNDALPGGDATSCRCRNAQGFLSNDCNDCPDYPGCAENGEPLDLGDSIIADCVLETLDYTEPVFPSCTVENVLDGSSAAEPNQDITITASDFAAGAELRALVGDDAVPAILVGGTVTVTVPADQPPGPLDVTVEAVGQSALQAACSIDVIAVTCGDADNDGCNDCAVVVTGSTAVDGADLDGDGLCDLGDPDDDNDGVPDVDDRDPRNPFVCEHSDEDACDDCSIGVDGFGPLPDNTPANDGDDLDGDGLCDLGDPDDDNDATVDTVDVAPSDPVTCGDSDQDGCDDCTNGSQDPLNDGTDVDMDGVCATGDPDDSNPNVCGDRDSDTCDDCSSGTFDLLNDGGDADGDGTCDLSDDCTDADGDGLGIGTNGNIGCDTTLIDQSPNDSRACRDTDNDGCDDCSQGSFDPNNDGTDQDNDGVCGFADNCPVVSNPGQEDSERAAGADGMCGTADDNPTLNGPDGVCGTPDDRTGDGRGDACDPCAVDTPDDVDFDGVCNADDVCPGGDDNVDSDGDGVPDFCDTCLDDDQDGFGDPGNPSCSGGPTRDNCPDVANPSQADADQDGAGDACDNCNDPDRDGICDPLDNCPVTFNPGQLDVDGDGSGDACDTCSDPDADGFGDPGLPGSCPTDNCPDDTNPGQEDNDGDTLGDACDGDDDNDGVSDVEETTNGTDPFDPSVCGDVDGDTCDDCGVGLDGFGFGFDQQPGNDGPDIDGDGLCDAGDPDDDNDGVPDAAPDNCPFTSNPVQADGDGDGVGDACDACTDTDGDGYGDPGFPVNTCPVDNCPDVANPDQADGDGDGTGDACDGCNPLGQGAWHRQCLGVGPDHSVGGDGIAPLRDENGPPRPTEPDFHDVCDNGLCELSGAVCTTDSDCAKLSTYTCAEDRLQTMFSTYTEANTCSAMDADPPSDECQRAMKHLTSLVLNQCSQRLGNNCKLDFALDIDNVCDTSVLTDPGNDGLSVDDVITSLDLAIQSADPVECKNVSRCAGLLNEGDVVVDFAGESAPAATEETAPRVFDPRKKKESRGRSDHGQSEEKRTPKRRR
jgi:hypothetical protein